MSLKKIGRSIKKTTKSVSKQIGRTAKQVAKQAVRQVKTTLKMTPVYQAYRLVSKLLAKKPEMPEIPAFDGGSSGGSSADQVEPGSRVQLPPLTNNMVPIVYGTAAVKPIMVDSKISQDNKFMWFVLALSEVPDAANGAIELSNTHGVKWNDKIAFKPDANGSAVTAFHDYKNGNPTIDPSPAGDINIWMYNRGSFSPIVSYPDFSSAVGVLSDSRIRADNDRWTSDYTMDNLAFMVVRLMFNRDDDVTGLEDLTVYVKNSITNPADVIFDYMTNPRYGWGLPLDMIDLNSLQVLREYSDELITYTQTQGDDVVTKVVPRYRIDGSIDTRGGCLQNTLAILDTCDSWLSWNEVAGQWKVTVNRSREEQHGEDVNNTFALFAETIPSNTGSTTPPDHYAFITSKINVSLGNRGSLFNEYEAQYMWQGEGNTLADLSINGPGLSRFLSVTSKLPANLFTPNEPDKVMKMNYPFTTNPARATFLANRRLASSRAAMAVDVTCDYSAIQVEAGDVVRVYSKTHGWDASTNMPNGKLFRVLQVTEISNGDGALEVDLMLSEYSAAVYTIPNLDAFVPPLNTGMTDPGLISQPVAPVISGLFPNQTVPNFTIQLTVPPDGLVTSMEIWFFEGPQDMSEAELQSANFQLLEALLPSDTSTFAHNEIVIRKVTAMPKNTTNMVYYFKTRAVGSQKKSTFSGEPSIEWNPAEVLYTTSITVPASANIDSLPETTSTLAAGPFNSVPFIEVELPRITDDGTTSDTGTYRVTYENIGHVLTGQVLSGPVGPVDVFTVLQSTSELVDGSVVVSDETTPVLQGSLFTVTEPSWARIGVNTLPVLEYNWVEMSNNGDVVIIQTSAGGSTRLSVNGGSSFVTFNGINSMHVSGNGQVLYRVPDGTTSAMQRSTNNGASWQNTAFQNNRQLGSVQTSFDGTKIFAFPYRTTTTAETFPALSTNSGATKVDLTNHGLPSGILIMALCMTDNGNHLLAGYRGEFLYKSSNGGQSFFPLTNLGQREFLSGFNGVLQMSEDGQIIWAHTTTGLFKTIDGGTTWNLMTNVQFTTVRYVTQCSADGQRVYLINGEYSENGGVTWQLSSKPPGYPGVHNGQRGNYWFTRDTNTGVFQQANGDGLMWKQALATNSLTINGLPSQADVVYNLSYDVKLQLVYRFIHNASGVPVTVKPTSVYTSLDARRYIIERTA